MRLEGMIVNGRVELDAPADLPEGTRVRVEPVSNPLATPPPDPAASAMLASGVRADGRPLTSLNRLLLSLSGRVAGLPPDMSVNHDHYIHGTKKRS